VVSLSRAAAFGAGDNTGEYKIQEIAVKHLNTEING
jgi:hypothetical protein